MLKSFLKKIVKINYLFLAFFVCFNYQLLSQSSSNDQSESWETTKQGGVCFRTSNNYPIESFLQFAELFDKWNYKFNFALALGQSQVSAEEYIQGISEMQANGHEMLDITPNFKTNYFKTIFDPNLYTNIPGVDHIVRSKICLEFGELDLSKRIGEGYVDIQNDKVYGEREFDGVNYEYIYFPSLDKLARLNGPVDNDLYAIIDVWEEPIDLGELNNVEYYLFMSKNIQITNDALLLLGWETLKLADFYNLDRPFSWIQPGGYIPKERASDVKTALGDNLGYLAGAVYSPTSSKKVHNEFNPNNDAQFGLPGGDFWDYEWSLQDVKKQISDRVAKHRLSISRSVFGSNAENFNNYLLKVDELLQWCHDNNIPVKTYSDWANSLYRTKQNPYINVFPSIGVDLDKNGIPDGYNDSHFNNVIIDSTDGSLNGNNYSFSISSQDTLCAITNLGGIEKGDNYFEIWTKGSPGNFIEVTFDTQYEKFLYKFPAEDTTWTLYQLGHSINGDTTLIIPDSVSLIHIVVECSEYISGDVKISGMALRSGIIDEIPPSMPENVKGLGHENRVELSWDCNGEEDIRYFEIYRSTIPNYDPDTLSENSKISERSFIDFNVESNNTYYYKIASVDFAGNKSDYTNDVSVFITTDIDDDQSQIQNYELLQNYPNPFNPNTSINFNIPDEGNVKLIVYNIIGERVATLVNERLTVGSYKINFDASALPSGLYIYRLQTNNFSDSKKMILLK